MFKGDLKIGLALSGGGSRAVGFHLGCLKALHDLGYLKYVDVVSCVSGGSVIGAAYAYSSCSFEEFEQLIRKNLKLGFVRAGLVSRTALYWTPLMILNIFGILGVRLINFALRTNIRCPYVFSISYLLEISFKKQIFKDMKLNSVTRSNVQIIFNSCEIQTKTAFRFSNQEVNCWKFGKVNPEKVDISTAVLCSAAYPVFVPAYEATFEFSKNNIREKKRVVLSDGGIHENLGVSVLIPNRSKEVGLLVRETNFIIACDAGNDSESQVYNQNMVNRLAECFNAVMRRTQVFTFAKLHELKRNKEIKGFILAYLNQDDRHISPYQFNYSTKKVTVKYPTNFSAMDDDNINLLVERGRSVMSELIFKYL